MVCIMITILNIIINDTCSLLPSEVTWGICLWILLMKSVYPAVRRPSWRQSEPRYMFKFNELCHYNKKKRKKQNKLKMPFIRSENFMFLKWIEILQMCCTYTLIQNQETDLGQIEFSSGNKIIQSSRCSHHYVYLITESSTQRVTKKKNREKETRKEWKLAYFSLCVLHLNQLSL